jgi:peptidyl-tRNA hydrolase, PTH2 family
LKLPRGKLAAQVAHASIAAFLEALPEARRAWLQVGMPKVVLRCDSEEQLLALQAEAERNRLPAHLIKDAGHTVLAPGTVTCLGVGPAPEEAIDAVTGELKLVR